MKIGILNSLYERGGAETVMRAMAADFVRQGQEVFLIVTTARGKNGTKNKTKENGDQTGPELEINPRLKIYYLNSLFSNLNKYPYLIRLGWQLINLINLHKYYQIKKILKSERPDLIITHNLMGLGYLTPNLIKHLGIKHEHYLHDIQLLHPSGLMFYGQEKIIDSLGAKIYQALTKCLFKKVERVISPSNWLLDLYTSRGFFKRAEKIVKPTREIKNAGRQPAAQVNYQKFLYVGQVEVYKGVPFLIKAWLKAGRAGELIIVGQGRDAEKCKKLVERASVERADESLSKIKFLSELDHDGVIKLMAMSDCLIVPSLVYENSPTVIYEAWENKLPVIASRIGGIPELIKRAGGVLFTPGDEPELINLIKSLDKN